MKSTLGILGGKSGGILGVLMMTLMLCLNAKASNLSQDFNFDGYLLDGSSNPLVGTYAVKFQIYNPASTCLLFEENHASVTTGSDGSFSLKIGTGTRASAGVDGGLSWKTIFQNTSVLRAAATANCTPGYTPASGDQRKLRVTVGGTVLTPDYTMSSVPMATVAESLQGKNASDFMAATSYTLPATDGSNTQVLQTDGAGTVSWATVSAGGITSINGLTGGAQTFNNGTSGTSPGWSAAGAIHTLNIPMANTAAVTGGLISKTEYDSFNAKMNAVSGTTTNNILRWNGGNWVETNGLQVSAAGDVLLLNSPTANSHAATKVYVDTALSNFVSMTGGPMTGNLTMNVLGTQTNASFAFSNSNTGFYSPVANQIGVTANGVEKMRVTGSGVGFGTTNPTAALEVNGTFKVGPGGTGSPIYSIKNYAGANCTFSSLAPGATGSCTTAVTGIMIGDVMSMSCQPDGAAPTQVMAHSCYLSANNTATIVVTNHGGVSMTPPSWWSVTVIGF